jgi:hypothetical protein
MELLIQLYTKNHDAEWPIFQEVPVIGLRRHSVFQIAVDRSNAYKVAFSSRKKPPCMFVKSLRVFQKNALGCISLVLWLIKIAICFQIKKMAGAHDMACLHVESVSCSLTEASVCSDYPIPLPSPRPALGKPGSSATTRLLKRRRSQPLFATGFRGAVILGEQSTQFPLRPMTNHNGTSKSDSQRWILANRNLGRAVVFVRTSNINTDQQGYALSD